MNASDDSAPFADAFSTEAADASAVDALAVDAAGDQHRAVMSALADGDAAALQRGCELWRSSADARATWHAYHLIGDVLRSDDLAAAPAGDAAFLAGVRARLAAEPAVLAPAPLAAAAPARARGGRWLTPAAVAAGFVAVVGVLAVARLSSPSADAPTIAVGPAPVGGLSLASSGGTAARPLVIEGRLIRDARLDGYLRAHREGLGGVPAAVPGGMPRSIETLAPLPPNDAAAATAR